MLSNRYRVSGVDEVINCHHNYVTRERHFGENVIDATPGATKDIDRVMEA